MQVVMQNRQGCEIDRWSSWQEFLSDVARFLIVPAEGDVIEIRDDDPPDRLNPYARGFEGGFADNH